MHGPEFRNGVCIDRVRESTGFSMRVTRVIMSGTKPIGFAPRPTATCPR